MSNHSLIVVPLFTANVLFSFLPDQGLCALTFNPSNNVSNLKISKTEFMQRCHQLCHLLQCEFFFNKVSLCSIVECSVRLFVFLQIVVVKYLSGTFIIMKLIC